MKLLIANPEAAGSLAPGFSDRHLLVLDLDKRREDFLANWLGHIVRHAVPVRTFADWKEPLPGYLEIDFVSHGGTSMQGTFLWSLVATDVCSGWTEAVPLLAREQALVAEGIGRHPPAELQDTRG